MSDEKLFTKLLRTIDQNSKLKSKDQVSINSLNNSWESGINFTNSIRKKIASDNGNVIILTGNVGAGKSYILSYFKKLGFYTINSDQLAKKIMSNGRVQKRIIDALTLSLKSKYRKVTDILNKDNFSNIDKINKILFLNRRINNILMPLVESIVHPLVQKKQREIIKKVAINGDRSVIIESPLFIENNNKLRYNSMISVLSDINLRVARISKRKDMTVEKFIAIHSRQFSSNVQIEKSDYCVINNGNRLYYLNQIKKILKRHIKKNANSKKRDSSRYRNNRFTSDRWSQDNRNRMHRAS